MNSLLRTYAAGQSMVECLLVFPLLLALLLMLGGFAAVCVRGQGVLLSAFQYARAAKVFSPMGDATGVVPVVVAVPSSVSDEVLSGGDNASPYCKVKGGLKGPWECNVNRGM